MANTIPCPNPACTHDFSMAEVQASAQLLCPKCGFRMQGKAPAKPKAPPVAKPVAAAPKPIPAPAPAKVPMATPMSAAPVAAGNPPLATPIVAAPAPAAPANSDESIPDASFFNPDVAGSTGTLVRTSGRAKKGFNWHRLLVNALAIGFAVCVVVSAVAAIVMWFPDVRGMFSNNNGGSFTPLFRNSKGESEKVYKLLLSRDDWSPDTEIKRDFKAHSAWKHNTEDFWFALIVKDYGMSKPRDAEMLSDAVDKLEQRFGVDMELAKMVEPVKFAGLNAQKLSFKGTINSAPWLGDCYIFFNNGIGYWLFASSPDRDVLDRLAGELAEKNVVVLSDRRGWREQPTPMATYKSENGKLELTVPKEIWEKSKTSKDEYETGEMLLAGTYKRAKENRKNAILTIFTVENKGDLAAEAKAAREFLDAKYKQGNENYKVLPLDADDGAPGQKETGELTSVGNRRGRIIDLKLQFQDEKKRYFLVAVIVEENVCYVILCECTFESRQIWRQDFLDVLRSLSVKG
jgi:hypothetical protein